MKFHPLCELFPTLEKDDLKELADDIRANGLQFPIITFEGQILDGRNRLRACELAKVAPRYEIYEGNDPLGKVISLNLTRRHLTIPQRALIGQSVATMRQGDYRKGPIGPSSNLISLEEAAHRLNVSERSIKRARQLVNDDKTGALVKAVRDGKMSLHAALKATKQPEPKERSASSVTFIVIANIISLAVRIDNYLEEFDSLTQAQKDATFKSAMSLLESLQKLMQRIRPTKIDLRVEK